MFIFLWWFFHFSSYLSFNFPDFCLSHFAPFNGESETIHCIVVLTCCHRNNQSSTYELFLIQIGGTKFQPCQVWTLSGLRFLTDSWLTEKVSHFAPGYTKCDQIRSFLRFWSHLLKKSLMESLIFCAVQVDDPKRKHGVSMK